MFALIEHFVPEVIILLVGQIVILVALSIAGIAAFRESRKARALIEANTVILGHVQSEWQFQHELLTPIRTVRGLMRALELSLENGGLSVEQRSKFYAAIEEQIETFEQIARAKGELAA